MKHTLKILFIVTFLYIVSCCIILTAYNNKKSSNEDTTDIFYDNFIEINDTTYFMSDTKYRIVYDKNTKVEYYCITYNGYRSVNITLCPVYNSDGSIKVYDGE